MLNIRDRMLSRLFGRCYKKTAAWCIASCAPITEVDALKLVEQICYMKSRGHGGLRVCQTRLRVNAKPYNWDGTQYD